MQNFTIKSVNIPAIKIPQIKISIKLSAVMSFEEQSQLTCSNDCYQVFKHCFNHDTFHWREELVLICLTRANTPIGFYSISSGGISGTFADPKVIFTTALKAGAASIAIAHNHPSGNLKPSEADKHLTKQLIKAGKYLDIPVVDHLILTAHSYFSFADNGLMNC